ncbi:hypothetical protein [Delftia lacustris]|uniref:hypothetical protein n=1 Tax=Delftia lacustris TaxID=558537 RepID=UPI003313039F
MALVSPLIFKKFAQEHADLAESPTELATKDLEWLTPLRHRPPQSSYARCPHGTTTCKQRTVATTTTPHPCLRTFRQRRCAQARSQR